MDTFNVYQLYVNGVPEGSETDRLKYVFEAISDIESRLKDADEIIIKVIEEKAE